MILNKKPLAIAEVIEYAKNEGGKEELIKYLKKFGKLSKEKVEKIKASIVSLNNPKIKERDIVKVIDFLPKDAEDANKIFAEASLNEEETRALVEIISKV